jgi:hypothetical protein
MYKKAYAIRIYRRLTKKMTEFIVDIRLYMEDKKYA